MVNTLPINDDPGNGGVVPRSDPDGRWLPPTLGAGFHPQIPGQMYRWRDGVVDKVGVKYQLYQGNWWFHADPDPVQLTHYRSATTFFCNSWHHFQTFQGDASGCDIERMPFPGNRWYPLTFRHERGLSRIDYVGEEQSLAAYGGGWVDELGLTAYNYTGPDPEVDVAPPPPPPSEGLAGNLSILIALIAFSCRNRDLDAVLLHDRAWRRRQWRNHGRPNGRSRGRGKVVNVYLDPENPQGSTDTTLYELEWTGAAIIR